MSLEFNPWSTPAIPQVETSSDIPESWTEPSLEEDLNVTVDTQPEIELTIAKPKFIDTGSEVSLVSNPWGATESHSSDAPPLVDRHADIASIETETTAYLEPLPMTETTNEISNIETQPDKNVSVLKQSDDQTHEDAATTQTINGETSHTLEILDPVPSNSTNQSESDEELPDDDDFGSFESTSIKPIVKQALKNELFSEPLNDILLSIFPKRDCKASMSDDEREVTIYRDMLLTSGKSLKYFTVLTSNHRQFEYLNTNISNFRSRNYADKSNIHIQMKKIATSWTVVEKRIASDSAIRQEDKANLFNWSTKPKVVQQEPEKKGAKESSTKDVKHPQKLNQKLLKLASQRGRKIIEERQEILKQNKIRIEKERKEREERFLAEKKKKEEEFKKYGTPFDQLSATSSLGNAPAGFQETNKKKSLFSKIFGTTKSKIASDSFSSAHFKQSAVDTTKPLEESQQYDNDDEIMFQLKSRSNLNLNNSNYLNEFNASDDENEEGESEVLDGYNQINFKEGQNGSPEVFEGDSDNQDVTNTGNDNDDDDNSFDDFLQTPVEDNVDNQFDTSTTFERAGMGHAQVSQVSQVTDVVNTSESIVSPISTKEKESVVDVFPSETLATDVLIKPTPKLQNTRSYTKDIEPQVESSGDESNEDEFSEFVTSSSPKLSQNHHSPLQTVSPPPAMATWIEPPVFSKVKPISYSDSDEDDWGNKIKKKTSDQFSEKIMSKGTIKQKAHRQWGSFSSITAKSPQQIKNQEVAGQALSDTQNLNKIQTKRMNSPTVRSNSQTKRDELKSKSSTSSAFIPEDLVPTVNSSTSFYKNSIINSSDPYSRSGMGSLSDRESSSNLDTEFSEFVSADVGNSSSSNRFNATRKGSLNRPSEKPMRQSPTPTNLIDL
ncbi:hypothetical protein CANARDRAFT_29899 [[Candida] arabinofermentans NRRL YB-2248]|uniref:Uncharacterized protein n=1 Tax=[Candida] arabinofermentans NRRL YB-2248 TaxID=983967 RepID=A0A1E4SVA8_9ASCO|nr:hypothetical protein CANARDRAFT_29899 [[Candida] arabinofermentans NRRL YB-2248]